MNSCYRLRVKCISQKQWLCQISSECKISRFTKHKPTEEQKVIQNKYDECLDQQLSLLDKSIRYSYAYLFSTKRQPTDRIFDNRQVQIRDFYNQAIAKMVSVYDLRYPQKCGRATNPYW